MMNKFHRPITRAVASSTKSVGNHSNFSVEKVFTTKATAYSGQKLDERIAINNHDTIYKHFSFVGDSKTGELIAQNEEPKLSHVISKDNAPLLKDTFHSLLRKQCETYDSDSSKQECLFYFDETNEKITYKQFVYDVECTAKSLVRLGITKGDRVGIWLPNNYAWLRYFYACAEIGAISVSLNTGYVSKELEYCINLCQIKCLIIQPTLGNHTNYCENIYKIIPELYHMPKGIINSLHRDNNNGEISNGNVFTLKHIISIKEKCNGMLFDDDLINISMSNTSKHNDDHSNMLKKLQNNLHYHDTINLQFTSGTTGPPKGCATSHYQLINNGYHIGNRMVLTNNDKYVCASPLFHTMGTVCFHTASITNGTMQIFPSEAFDPKRVLSCVSKMNATAICGVPTMYNRMLNNYHENKDEYNVSTLRTGLMAGMVCPVNILSQCINTFGMKEMVVAYGMTETSPVSLQSAADTPFDKKVSTVGTVSSHTEVKLIDPSSSSNFADNNFKTVNIGERGEVCTKGYLVMPGYWCQPDKTRDTIDSDGFVHTGDIGIMDKDGYVTIVDRLKDIIIRGGENIYPKEIEEAIRKHDNIYDVAIVSVPDSDLGEEIAAFIKTKNGDMITYDELKLFLKDELAYYKIPKLIYNLDINEDIPQTASGKIQKFKLRARAIEQIGKQKK